MLETLEYNGFIVCIVPGGDSLEVVISNCRYF